MTIKEFQPLTPISGQIEPASACSACNATTPIKAAQRHSCYAQYKTNDAMSGSKALAGLDP